MLKSVLRRKTKPVAAHGAVTVDARAEAAALALRARELLKPLAAMPDDADHMKYINYCVGPLGGPECTGTLLRIAKYEPEGDDRLSEEAFQRFILDADTSMELMQNLTLNCALISSPTRSCSSFVSGVSLVVDALLYLSLPSAPLRDRHPLAPPHPIRHPRDPAHGQRRVLFHASHSARTPLFVVECTRFTHKNVHRVCCRYASVESQSVSFAIDDEEGAPGAWGDLASFAWPGDEETRHRTRRGLYVAECVFVGIGM